MHSLSADSIFSGKPIPPSTPHAFLSQASYPPLTNKLFYLIFFPLIIPFLFQSKINMQALTSSSPSLNYLYRTRTSHNRFIPTPTVVKCGYDFEQQSVLNGVGSSRADWQSSCAILASKVVSQEKSSGDKNGGSADHIAAVNGHKTAVTDLVPIGNLTGTDNNKPLPPKPLSISDLSPAPMHGAELRVAYQGVPGAYSEAAAGKAYPNCQAIPCDQFEVAFSAVELWIADRAVLPVENSLGSSIHRNYDLLLRHRLHIFSEERVQANHPCGAVE